MGHDHDPPPAPSRFRAFTASLGFSSAMSRSSSDQSSSPLRPVSASSLRSLYGNFTLYLRVHSAQHLAAVTQGSYCKIYLGDTPLLGGFGQGKSLVNLEKHARQGSSHQTFHTKVQMSAKRDCPEWNEKFQMNVRDPKTEILTIRVKNHVLLYSPAIGACVVHLRQLQLGVTLDEWFPLYKNDKPSGQLRLQICLQESVQNAVPERRYSQPSEEIMQRMIQEHREQQENARREVERKQQEKWKQMQEDEMKLVGLREQNEREEKWREQCKRQEKKLRQQEEHNSDSDLPASFKNRGVKEEEDAAAQLMSDLRLKESAEGNQKQPLSSAVSSGYTVYGVNSSGQAAGFTDREMTSFGTIRLSVEDLDQVVHNALPTSDSSDAMSEQERHRRLRKNRDDKKRSRSKPKKHSRRRGYSDGESSDTSSPSSREARKYSSRSKMAEEKRPTMPESGSSLSQHSNQNENRQDWEIPNTLSFPPSTSDDLSSSSDEESRRRRRRRAEKARKREKEKKRRSKRKTAKYRGTYDSSDSSSYFSSSLSSSLSSSEEERLRRKLKKKKKAKKSKARAMLGESGGSRASTRTSGMQQSHKLSYADSRGIDFIPCMTQQPRLDTAATNQTNGGRSSQPESTVTSSSFESSTARQQPLHSSKVSTDYGPDGVGFDEPDKPPMPQYPRQTTNEQTNAELMRSFCF